MSEIPKRSWAALTEEEVARREPELLKRKRLSLTASDSLDQSEAWRVPVGDALLWPILTEGSTEVPTGRRIPNSAFAYLRNHCDVDLATPEFSFSKRGRAFIGNVTGKAPRKKSRT